MAQGVLWCSVSSQAPTWCKFCFLVYINSCVSQTHRLLLFLWQGRPWSKSEEAFLNLHITCGLGFYHHMLLRLQSEFQLQYMGLLDFPLSTQDQSKSVPSAKSVKWAEESAQRCLICLGDLCRYKIDLKLNSSAANQALASRYYYQVWQQLCFYIMCKISY